MTKILAILISVAIVMVAAANASDQSDLSKCLAAAGVNVMENLVARTFVNNTEYIDLNFQWQERGEYRFPMAYLKVQSTVDVQCAVKCARRLALSVVARSGGHGYLKYAYGQSDDRTLVLDLQTLNSITINRAAKVASIDAGARTGHVAYQLWQNGNFIIPYGECVSVGYSGYTLGGGHSLFSYLYGMTSDSVIEMEVVNADGDLLTVNSQTNEDLFWALRGAGGSGSFGIVTKFVNKLYEAPLQIVNGSVEYRLERFLEFYEIFQDYIRQTYQDPIFYGYFMNKTHIIGIFYDVQSVAEAETIGTNRVEGILDRFPSPDGRTEMETMTYEEYLTYFVRIARSHGYIKSDFRITQPSDLMKVNRFGIGTEWFKAKSFFVKKFLSRTEILALQELIADVNLPDLYLSAETFTGNIQNHDAQMDSAFVHRDSYYYVFVYMIREKDDDPVVSAKLNEFFEKSKEIFNHTTSYQNFPDNEMDDFLERYYGNNLPRLIDIKSHVDPYDFFNTNPQSIPVKSTEGCSVACNSGFEIVLISLSVIMLRSNPL